MLAAELCRLDTGDQLLFGGAGPLRFADEAPEPTRSPTKLVAVGGTALALVIAGMVLGIKALNANAENSRNGNGDNTAQTSTGPSPNLINPKPVVLNQSQVRIVDPKGDRTELKNPGLTVDGDLNTAWRTDGYKNRPELRRLQAGHGHPDQARQADARHERPRPAQHAPAPRPSSAPAPPTRRTRARGTRSSTTPTRSSVRRSPTTPARS